MGADGQGVDARRGGAQGALRLAPAQLLGVAAAFALLVNLLVVVVALGQPYFGVDLDPAEAADGVVIAALDPDGPMAQAGLAEGAVIVAIDSAAAPRAAVHPAIAIDDPDYLPRHADISAFVRQSREIARHYGAETIVFEFADGERRAVSPLASRPVRDVFGDVRFISSLISGNLVFGIGALLWVYRRDQTALRLLFGAAGADALIMWTASVIWSREIVLADGLLGPVVALNALGAIFYPLCLLCLVLVYPGRLVSQRVIVWLLAGGAVYWLNHVLEVVALPAPPPMFVFFGAIVFGVAAMAVQWRRSERRPIERAQASLIALCNLVFIAVMLAVYLVPIVTTGRSLGGLLWMSGLLSTIPFFGFAAGVTRYRLFDLPEWWFNASVWIISGATIALLEFMLFVFVGLRSLSGLAIATLAVGWVYFPMRQWLLGRVFRSGAYKMHEVMPGYLSRLSDARTATDFDQSLVTEAKRLFSPAALVRHRGESEEVRIEENGLALTLPMSTPGQSLRLEAAGNATRLFNRRDVALANALIDVTRRYRAQIEAIETSVNAERRRIARDLHDTVGAKLVTLIHNAPSPDVSQRARDVTGALKDTIWVLRSEEAQPLATAISRWSEEALNRAEAAGVALAWRQDRVGRIALPAQTLVSLGNILREAMSNLIRHSEAREAQVSIGLTEDAALVVEMAHDGVDTSPESWRRGFGIQGMQERVAELGGAISWSSDPDRPGWVRLRLQAPLKEDGDGRQDASG